MAAKDHVGSEAPSRLSTTPSPLPLLQPISEAASVSDVPHDCVGLVLQADKLRVRVRPRHMQGGQFAITKNQQGSVTAF
jgi:hypothetical protein